MATLWMIFVAASLSDSVIAVPPYRPVYVNNTYIGNLELHNLTNRGGLNLMFHPVNNDLNVINQFKLNFYQFVNRPNDSNYPKVDPPNSNYHLPDFNDNHPGYYTNTHRTNNHYRNLIFNRNNWYIIDYPGAVNGFDGEGWIGTEVNNNIERLVGFNWGFNAINRTINNLRHPGFINNSQYNANQINDIFRNSGFGNQYRFYSISALPCDAGLENVYNPTPGEWSYDLWRFRTGPIDNIVFTELLPGTYAEVRGEAAMYWFVAYQSDEEIIFATEYPGLPFEVMGEFVLINDTADDENPVFQETGGCGMFIPGPGIGQHIDIPPTAIPEGEPVCHDEYVDVYNGGCDSYPYAFLPIVFGDVIAGQSGTFLLDGIHTVDSDWYEVIVLSESAVNVTVTAEFPVDVCIFDGNYGCPATEVRCGFGGAFDDVKVSACVESGIYWIRVAPKEDTEVSCPSDYVLTCYNEEPCPPPPANDVCEGAMVIASCPLEIVATTVYATTDDDLRPCITPRSGPGVFYRLTGNGSQITASLCDGTNYDAALSLFCGSDCEHLSCLAEANDDCGLQPELTWCSEAGREYYLMVHGNNGDAGTFRLLVTCDDTGPCYDSPECSDCYIECPPEGSPEDPEIPGPEHEYEDPNGGCNLDLPSFGTIACGETICGYGFTYENSDGENYRDTDWYLFSTGDYTRFTVSVTAEFPIMIGVMSLPSCAEREWLAATSEDIPCTDAALTTICLPPGDYCLFVAPMVYTGIPIPRYYWVNMSCETCVPPPPPPNDNCEDAVPLSGDVSLDFTNESATTDGPADTYPCNPESDIWYCYEVGCSTNVTVNLCGSFFDTQLAVYPSDAICTCPAAGTAIACDDDYCGPGAGSQVTINDLGGGDFLMIRVGGWGAFQGMGTMTIWSDPPCYCPPVEDVVVYLNADMTTILLGFTAPEAGLYEIYSTTDPNAPDDPDDSAWTLEETLEGIGWMEWTDPSEMVDYKNYLVIHNCSEARATRFHHDSSYIGKLNSSNHQ